MPQSKLKCEPCRKAKKKCEPGSSGKDSPCQRCELEKLQCSGTQLTSRAQVRQRQSAPVGMSGHEMDESLPLEIFWLERLSRYVKSAVDTYHNRLNLFGLDYDPDHEVIRLMERVENSRERLLLKVDNCSNPSSLAVALSFSLQSSRLTGRMEGILPHSQTLHHVPFDLLTQERRLFEDARVEEYSSELRTYTQGYDDMMHSLASIEHCIVPLVPPLHNLLLISNQEKQKEWMQWLHLVREDEDMLGRSLLHLALDLGNSNAVSYFFLGGSGIVTNDIDIWKRNPLHIASSLGIVDIVKFWISTRNEEIIDIDGLQALHYASAAGQEDIVYIMIDHDVEIDPRDNTLRTPLFYSAKNGHAGVADMLIENGASIESEDNWGWTPLLHAVENDNVSIVKLLLRYGASTEPMSKTSTFKSLPLREIQCQIIELLVRNGAARSDICRFYRVDPLLWAAKGDHGSLIQQLILHKEFRMDTSIHGPIALSYASEAGMLEVVAELLEEGVDPNQECPWRGTPLSYAVGEVHEAIVKELLRRKAAPNQVQVRYNDRPYLSTASRKGASGIVQALLSAGAYVNAKDSDGQTPILYAAMKEHSECVRIIIEAGADPFVSNAAGDTPLSVAQRDENLEVVGLIHAAMASSMSDNL